MSQDTSNRRTVYEAAGGEPAFTRLMDAFFERVEQDEILSDIYPDDLAPGKERLRLFFIQYWGGPTTYSEQRGHPRLRRRHVPFSITREAAMRWANHMIEAIREQGFDEEVENALLDYVIRFTPQFVNADELVSNRGPLTIVDRDETD